MNSVPKDAVASSRGRVSPLSTSVAVCLAVLGGLAGMRASAERVDAVTTQGPAIVPGEFTGDLRNAPAPSRASPPLTSLDAMLKAPRQSKTSVDVSPDPTRATSDVRATASMPGFIRNFIGLNNPGFVPSSTNGDVGPQYYIQSINNAYAIFDKTGTRITAFPEEYLWSSSATPPCDVQRSRTVGRPVRSSCRSLDSFPCIVWIQCLRRARFTHLSVPCRSKSGDPLAGGWWLYAVPVDAPFPLGWFHNQPKLGAWHDCIYMGANLFAPGLFGFTYEGAAFASLSRANLYSGAPLTYAIGYLPYPSNQVFSMYPSNNLGKGANAVSPGTPECLLSTALSTFGTEVPHVHRRCELRIGWRAWRRDARHECIVFV